MRWTLLLILAAGCSESEHDVKWSYEGETGPEHWAELDPAFALAATGQHQSPVDLGAARRGAPDKLDFHYLDTALEVEDNGHTIQVNVEAGSWFAYHGERFDLKQIHFHSPSEHTIDGRHFDMEAHCVHANDAGELAVVGFLIDAGEAAPVLEKVFDYLPEVGAKRAVPDFKMRLSRILPRNLDHYYHYSGSLTTPPCTEGVAWFVLETHATASARQIAAFREHYAGNNRPVQPLNDRIVEFD